MSTFFLLPFLNIETPNFIILFHGKLTILFFKFNKMSLFKVSLILPNMLK
jgi:hypothetical protein